MYQKSSNLLYRALVLVAVVFFAPNHAGAEEDRDKKIQKLTTEVIKFCETVEARGESTRFEVGAEVMATIRKLGGKLFGGYETESYEGVLQEDLPRLLESTTNCRVDVVELLVPVYFGDVSEPSVPEDPSDILIIDHKLASSSAMHLNKRPINDQCEIKWSPVYRITSKINQTLIIEEVKFKFILEYVDGGMLLGGVEYVEYLSDLSDSALREHVYFSQGNAVFTPNQSRILQVDVDLCLHIHGERRVLDQALVEWIEHSSGEKRPLMGVLFATEFGFPYLTYELMMKINGKWFTFTREDQILLEGGKILIPSD